LSLVNRLDELEKKEEQQSDAEGGGDEAEGKEEEEEKEGEGEEGAMDDMEEEDLDEEMDEGTDYINNYFDNGESYLDEEEDNLDDGPIYWCHFLVLEKVHCFTFISPHYKSHSSILKNRNMFGITSLKQVMMYINFVQLYQA